LFGNVSLIVRLQAKTRQGMVGSTIQQLAFSTKKIYL
jgi:hypothetical protein